MAPSPSRAASPVTTGSSRVSASTTPSRPSPGTPSRRLRPRPSAKEDGVVAREQLRRRRARWRRPPASPAAGGAHPRPAPDLDAGALHLGHLVGGHLAGVAPGHDAVRAQPAGLRASLEDRDLDPVPAQLGRAGEAGRTRPDDGDALAGRGTRRRRRAGPRRGRRPSRRAGGRRSGRPVERHPHARAFAQALDRADAGAGAPQRVGGQDGPGAAVEVAGRDRPDEPGHVDAGGAGGDARRVEAEEAAGGLLARCLQAQPGIAIEPSHRSPPGGADGRRAPPKG